jgi:hypothetical protein
MARQGYAFSDSNDLCRQKRRRWTRKDGILAFIAQYPSGQAFIDMIRDPVYREAVKHRQAAVVDSRLIRLAPATPGALFGEEG